MFWWFLLFVFNFINWHMSFQTEMILVKWMVFFFKRLKACDILTLNLAIYIFCNLGTIMKLNTFSSSMKRCQIVKWKYHQQSASLIKWWIEKFGLDYPFFPSSFPLCLWDICCLLTRSSLHRSSHLQNSSLGFSVIADLLLRCFNIRRPFSYNIMTYTAFWSKSWHFCHFL